MDVICKHCGKTFDVNYAILDENSNVICRDCYESHYTRCSKCGVAIPLSEGREICYDCDSVVYKKPINSYGTKPIPRFKGKKYNDNKLCRYYGLELEYNYTSPTLAYMLFNDEYKSNMIYNKSDSSVGNGVEIVTNPLDKKVVTELLHKMKDGLDKISEEKRYNKNAGIHIHVNRASLDTLTIYKLSYLLNVSATEDEKRIMYYISGRNKLSTTRTSEYHYSVIGGSSTKRSACRIGDRYRAINLNNANTVEFRMFASTTNVDNILMYIDFVDDMIEYASKFSFKNMNISSFISWEKSNCKNELIKRRIKNFERHNNTFDSKENIYRIDIKDIKGINIKYWDTLIEIIKRNSIDYSIKQINMLKTNPDSVRVNYTSPVKNKSSNLIKRLEKTLGRVIINKIIKEQEQCA